MMNPSLEKVSVVQLFIPLPGSNTRNVVDAGLPWRRLDALDQLRHLALECVGWLQEAGSEGDEQIAVVALGISGGPPFYCPVLGKDRRRGK
jgi:hypothetical protein